MTPSASQQSRVMGKPRKAKRARYPAVAATESITSRLQRACENALRSLAQQEQHLEWFEDLVRMEGEHLEFLGADEIEMLDAADDFGDVAEDGVDDGGPPAVPEVPTFNFVGVRDADRKRCARCRKFLPQNAVPEASFVNAPGSVCNTLSGVSVLGADDMELADDGASS